MEDSFFPLKPLAVFLLEERCCLSIKLTITKLTRIILELWFKSGDPPLTGLCQWQETMSKIYKFNIKGNGIRKKIKIKHGYGPL